MSFKLETVTFSPPWETSSSPPWMTAEAIVRFGDRIGCPVHLADAEAAIAHYSTYDYSAAAVDPKLRAHKVSYGDLPNPRDVQELALLYGY